MREAREYVLIRKDDVGLNLQEEIVNPIHPTKGKSFIGPIYFNN